MFVIEMVNARWHHTLLLRLRQGIQAEETAFRFEHFGGAMLPESSLESCSSLGRMVLGGMPGYESEECQREKERRGRERKRRAQTAVSN
jgi:hypothetical protein